MKIIIVLGIDHGTNYTGIAVYDTRMDKFNRVELLDLTDYKGDDVYLELFNRTGQWIIDNKIDVLAIEKPMAITNAKVTRILTQAYTSVKLAGLDLGIRVIEVTPQQAKLAAGGHAQAEKQDVARMIHMQYKIEYDKLAVPVLYKEKRRQGQIKERLFDPSDACALCLGATALLKSGIER